jgi:hypothetical protein
MHNKNDIENVQFCQVRLVMFISGWMWWAGYIARVEAMSDAFVILVVHPEEAT